MVSKGNEVNCIKPNLFRLGWEMNQRPRILWPITGVAKHWNTVITFICVQKQHKPLKDYHIDNLPKLTILEPWKFRYADPPLTFSVWRAVRQRIDDGSILSLLWSKFNTCNDFSSPISSGRLDNSLLCKSNIWRKNIFNWICPVLHWFYLGNSKIRICQYKVHVQPNHDSAMTMENCKPTHDVSPNGKQLKLPPLLLLTRSGAETMVSVIISCTKSATNCNSDFNHQVAQMALHALRMIIITLVTCLLSFK